MQNKKHKGYKKILIIVFSFLIFTILTLNSIQNKDKPKTIVLASPGYDCMWVTGSCGNPINGNPTGGYKSSKAGAYYCKSDIAAAAVECPSGYYAMGGGCTSSTYSSATSGRAQLVEACPTDNPKLGEDDRSKLCNDWSGSTGYEWFYCKFYGGDTATDVKWETAYAFCCAGT